MTLSASKIAAIALAMAALASPAVATSANADPGSFPFCPAKENPDCFLLNQVNEKVFPIVAGQEGPVIAHAYAACQFMAADHSGSNPLLDYGVWFTRQPGGDALSTDKAADFAMYAARAYCPGALP